MVMMIRIQKVETNLFGCLVVQIRVLQQQQIMVQQLHMKKLMGLLKLGKKNIQAQTERVGNGIILLYQKIKILMDHMYMQMQVNK